MHSLLLHYYHDERNSTFNIDSENPALCQERDAGQLMVQMLSVDIKLWFTL